MSRLLPRLWAQTCLAAAVLAVTTACARPRVPIAAAPTPASSRAPTRGEPTKKGTGSGGAGNETSSAVPLATVGVLGGAPEADVEYVRSRKLMLPVAAIRPDQLTDSFDEPRDGSRRHRAIDILAPRGTPVLAADDGHILRISWNSAGGNTVYATDADARLVYYYAHLDHYREGLAAGQVLVKGDTIGFVGTTGNAPKDIPHLHFQIMRMPHDGKYWNGDPIDPFPFLRGEGERP